MKSFISALAVLLPLTFSAQTECDPNNSFPQACQIVLSNLMGTVKGTINPNGDADYYWFNIPRSGVITYSVTNVPSNISMRAELFHESNQSSYLSSASGGDGQAVTGIKKVCPTGKYYIRLFDNHSFGGPYQSTDQYTLKVTVDTTDVHECNDSFGACTSINLNQNVQGTINSSGDVDYYCFEIPRSGVINFTVSNVPGLLSLRAELFHESNQGGYVHSAAGGDGQAITGIKRVCPAGRYYIKLFDHHSFGGPYQSPDKYNLKVTLDTADVHECNDSFVACTPISLNQNIRGAIHSSGDVDYFCFDIPRAGVITYIVSNVPGLLSLRAELYHESNQSSYVHSAAAGDGQAFTAIKKVCQAGRYYIKLFDNHSFGGPYQSPDLYNLKVTLDTTDIYECNDGFSSASPINCNTQVAASINTENDNDCFKFTLYQPDVVTVTATNVPTNLDLTLTLYGPAPSTTQLQPSVNGSTGASVTLVSATTLQPGTYYVCVTDNKANAAQYHLNIGCPSAVSTEEGQLLEKLKLFPNPSGTLLHLEIPDNQTFYEFAYEVRNLLGELEMVGNGQIQAAAIDVSRLPNGLHLIIVNTRHGRISRQFIKI